MEWPNNFKLRLCCLCSIRDEAEVSTVLICFDCHSGCEYFILISNHDVAQNLYATVVIHTEMKRKVILAGRQVIEVCSFTMFYHVLLQNEIKSGGTDRRR